MNTIVSNGDRYFPLDSHPKTLLNWNTLVTITPTQRGWDIWANYYHSLGLEHLPHSETLRLELWIVAHIFGPFLYNGCDLPFLNTWIELPLTEAADPPEHL